MKPLPREVLQLLQTLPEETCKVILNTNRRGHWEVEAFARYKVDELSAAQPISQNGPQPLTLEMLGRLVGRVSAPYEAERLACDEKREVS